MSVRARISLSLLAGSPLLLAVASAGAQESRLPTSDWRQADRGEAVEKKVTSPQSFAVELRFGGYSPQVDQEPGLTGAPYKEVFRPTGYTPQFYFGLEVDYLPLRIPYVGAIGPRVGWGFTSTSAKANFTGAVPAQASDADTSFTIFPMYVGAALRLDELMRRTGVPIVPFGKVGFGMAYWNTGTSSGGETYTKPDGTKVAPGGLSYGLEFALGGALCLNFLDPRSAARLDETTGVNHAYVFAEWMNNSFVGRQSSSMYVGTSTWVMGLAVDL